jgi:hypothetical protein
MAQLAFSAANILRPALRMCTAANIAKLPDLLRR